jgi:Protein of unknown function (DUF354)
MLQLPGKHIAFVFSDPAGANACKAMAKMTQAFSKTVSLYSNRDYSDPETLVIGTEEMPSLTNIDTIFLGTSHPASSGYFELNCLKEAKKEGIYTISFVDHWVNFELRFKDENNDVTFPDEIWVVDEKAKRLALAENLPSNLLKVTGNPYHSYLRTYWKSNWKGKSYLNSLGIEQQRFHILFAPDPISLRYKKEEIGFLEEDALNTIFNIVKALDDKYLHLILKCHPLQPMDSLMKILYKENRNAITIIKEADTLELINASDLVIGFYSNILLDAAALGKVVLRYFPGKEEADLLNHTTFLKVKNGTDLFSHLKRIIYG